MNIFQLMTQLPHTGLAGLNIPAYLLGCFRRKSISFCNGLTDENTIVYWFQSKSFSIDLRLPDAELTALCERQGWIGDTLWDADAQLLSWHIEQSYQPRIQWPEPAALLHMGNCILEFAPSKAYVEDWRQQAECGAFLGLKLQSMQNVATGETFAMHGGWVLCDQFMAFALGRMPDVAAKFALNDATLAHDFKKNLQNNLQKSVQHDLQNDLLKGLAAGCYTAAEIESYVVSVAHADGSIFYSTQRQCMGAQLPLTGFAFDATQQPNAAGFTVTQRMNLAGHEYHLTYMLDVYLPSYDFANHSACDAKAAQWMQDEQAHLMKHARMLR